MKIEQRDGFICQDYQDGKDIHELSRSHGLSERRISQILQLHNIPRRPRTVSEKRSLSRGHVRLGLHLYSHRFERGIDLFDAAEELGWSAIKLRKVEKGTTDVELLDLMDIAAYTQMKIGELLEKAYDS